MDDDDDDDDGEGDGLEEWRSLFVGEAGLGLSQERVVSLMLMKVNRTFLLSLPSSR